MTIGDRLRRLRKKTGISQEELAQQLHISRQSISKWENNISSPDVEMLIKLSAVFHISIDEMVANPLFRKKEKQIKKEGDKQQFYQLLLHYEGYFVLMMLLLCCTVAPLGLLFLGIVVRWNQRMKSPMKQLNYGIAIATFVYNIIALIMLFQ